MFRKFASILMLISASCPFVCRGALLGSPTDKPEAFDYAGADSGCCDDETPGQPAGPTKPNPCETKSCFCSSFVVSDPVNLADLALKFSFQLSCPTIDPQLVQFEARFWCDGPDRDARPPGECIDLALPLLI